MYIIYNFFLYSILIQIIKIINYIVYPTGKNIVNYNP